MKTPNPKSYKKLKLLALAFVLSFGLTAQWAVQTAYINSKIGTGGINMLAAKTIERHQLGVGLRVNLYSLSHKDDQNSTYTKRLYPLSFYQNFGFAAHYEYCLFKGLNPARISVFTDIQATYASKRNRTFLPYLTLPDGLVLYRERVDFYGPFLWLENTVGISIMLPIYKNLWLINKYGVGVISIIGDKFYAKQNTAILAGNWYEWEPTYTVQIGLSYIFNK